MERICEPSPKRFTRSGANLLRNELVAKRWRPRNARRRSKGELAGGGGEHRGARATEPHPSPSPAWADLKLSSS